MEDYDNKEQHGNNDVTDVDDEMNMVVEEEAMVVGQMIHTMPNL